MAALGSVVTHDPMAHSCIALPKPTVPYGHMYECVSMAAFGSVVMYEPLLIFFYTAPAPVPFSQDCIMICKYVAILYHQNILTGEHLAYLQKNLEVELVFQ